MTLKKFHGPIAAAVLLLALTGCGNDSQPAKVEEAPPLPATSTIAPDLTLFTSPLAQSLARTTPGLPVFADTFGTCDTTMMNFTNAAIRVVPLSLGVSTAVLPAAAALAGASGVTPVLESGGWFVYSYTVVYQDATFDLELRSKWSRDTNSILYEMYATADFWSVDVDHWLWYEGTCASDMSDGTWTFHTPAMEDTALISEPFLQAAWTWSSATDMSVSFTVVEEAEALAGDRLDYSLQGTWAEMQMYEATQPLEGTAAWDIETLGGWCEFPNYREGATSCWNETACDVVCPHR